MRKLRIIPNSERIDKLREGVKILIDGLTDRLVQNAGYLSGVLIVNSISSFLYWKIATRFFDNEQIGIATSLFSIGQLLITFAGLGLGIGLIRYLDESETPIKMINAVLTLTILSNFIVVALFMVSVRFWTPSLGDFFQNPENPLGYGLFVTILGGGILFQSIFLSLKKAKFAFWFVVLGEGLRVGIISMFSNFGAIGIIAAMLLGYLVAFIVGLLVFLPKIQPGYRFRFTSAKDIYKNIIGYSYKNYISNLLYRSPIMIIPPLALAKLGAESSAYAYIAWMFVGLLNIPASSLANSAFAEGSHSPNDMRRIIGKAMKYSIVLTIPLSLVVGFGGRFILNLFGKGFAQETIGVLRLLAITAPFAGLVWVYFSLLRVRKETRELIFLSAIVSFCTIVVPVFWIKQFGLIVTGVGWLGANLLVFTLVMVKFSKKSLVYHSRDV